MVGQSPSSRSDSSPSKKQYRKRSPYIRQDASSMDLFVNHTRSSDIRFISQMVNHVYEEFTLDEYVIEKQQQTDRGPHDFAETAAANVAKFPSAETLLSSDADLSTLFTCFETQAQAQRYAESIVPVTPQTDESLPQTRNQKRALVSVLTKAFKSTARATDNEKEVSRFRRQAHDIRLVEVMCWELLERCMKRSIMGPLCAQHEVDRVGSARYPMSFTERFDAIVRTMALYKGCCNALFKANYLDEFVDNPYFHLNRSFSNKLTNSRRAREIEAGKAALSPNRAGSEVEESPLFSMGLRIDDDEEMAESTTADLDDTAFAYPMDDPFI